MVLIYSRKQPLFFSLLITGQGNRQLALMKLIHNQKMSTLSLSISFCTDLIKCSKLSWFLFSKKKSFFPFCQGSPVSLFLPYLLSSHFFLFFCPPMGSALSEPLFSPVILSTCLLSPSTSTVSSFRSTHPKSSITLPPVICPSSCAILVRQSVSVYRRNCFEVIYPPPFPLSSTVPWFAVFLQRKPSVLIVNTSILPLANTVLHRLGFVKNYVRPHPIKYLYIRTCIYIDINTYLSICLVVFLCIRLFLCMCFCMDMYWAGPFVFSKINRQHVSIFSFTGT